VTLCSKERMRTIRRYMATSLAAISWALTDSSSSPL
jgi:hypothetical protein